MAMAVKAASRTELLKMLKGKKFREIGEGSFAIGVGKVVG
jgi:hypothetical protein